MTNYKPCPPVAEGDDIPDERPIRVLCYGNGDQFVSTDDDDTLGMSATGPNALQTLAMRLFQAGFDVGRLLILFKGGRRIGSVTIGEAAGVSNG